MSYTYLHTLFENGMLIITIQRPEKLNALNTHVMQELSEVVHEVCNRSDIKAAILIGAGEKSFIAGADITAFQGMNSEQAKKLSTEGMQIFFDIEKSPKPFLACVNGYCLGGGCELALSCHLRICSQNAIFGLPEVTLGIIPGYGGTQRLTRLIGRGRATEMILTGMPITADIALQYGLVNHVYPLPHLLNKGKELLSLITSKSVYSVASAIGCIQVADRDNNEGFALETEAFSKLFQYDDAKEGIQAFIEKRKPKFLG